MDFTLRTVLSEVVTETYAVWKGESWRKEAEKPVRKLLHGAVQGCWGGDRGEEEALMRNT